MVVFSKQQFYKAFTPEVTCKALHPWTDSCTNATFEILLQCFSGSLKFLFPLWLLKILYNYKKINNKMLKRQVILYIRTTLFFTFFGTSLICSNCIFRAVLGRFYYYVIGIGCGTLAGLNIFIESKEYRLGKTLLFTNLCIENIIRHFESKYSLKRTSMYETLVFSTFTSILMYLFKTTKGSEKLSTLWFYRPENESKSMPCENHKDSNKICNHKEGCMTFSFKSFFNYFGIGYAMELVKNLLRDQRQIIKNPSAIIYTLFNEKNFRFGLFMGGYVGLYKWSMCYLRNKKGESMDEHALLAGFFSGFTYYVKPSLPFTIMAFTTILQLSLLRTWGKSRKEKIRKWPIVELWAALVTGIIFHQRFLHSDTCVNYLIKALDLISNKRMSLVHQNLEKMVMARAAVV